MLGLSPSWLHPHFVFTCVFNSPILTGSHHQEFPFWGEFVCTSTYVDLRWKGWFLFCFMVWISNASPKLRLWSFVFWWVMLLEVARWFRSWGRVEGNRLEGSVLSGARGLPFCVFQYRGAGWALLLCYALSDTMLCFVTGPKHWCQVTMDWNLWQLTFSFQNCLSGIFWSQSYKTQYHDFVFIFERELRVIKCLSHIFFSALGNYYSSFLILVT